MRKPTMTRRELLVSLSASALGGLALAPNLPASLGKFPAAPQKQSMELYEINHFTLFGANAVRAREFYQGLFGMPVQAIQGAGGNLLKVGTGIEYIALAGGGAAGGGRAATVDHWSINMKSFNADGVMKALADHGVAKADPGTAPMIAWIRMRGPAQGGAPEGTGELYFNDPDGIKGQVQDIKYCGGAGALGDVCPPLDVPPPPKAPIALHGFSHFLLLVSNLQRSIQFYQDLFGMPISARRTNVVQLRIGAGPQFIAIRAAGDAKPGVDHICMTMQNFEPNRVLKILADHGVMQGKAGKTPMTSWVNMRGPADGGAPEGTPELYFNDPDGITIQLQDATFCGGGGVLGNVCA